MRVLFAVTHVGFLRNFESTLALLAQRGHQVHIVSDRGQSSDVLNIQPILDRLAAAYPGVFTTEVPGNFKRSRWYQFGAKVRAALDYWRYLGPEFVDAPKLRARGRENAPSSLVWLSGMPGFRSRAGVALLRHLFTGLERAIPPRHEIDRLFERERWDVLVVTPLLYFGSQQVDYVRAARRLGIPSVLGVGSWDHLTTKGLIHEIPDFVVVWNEHQKKEAMTLHAVPGERIIVTGAQAYDHWFDRQPSTSRQDFCARAGLTDDRPYLLYLCSSPFITPHEVGFVRRWIEAIRGSATPSVRDVGLIVRPHPQNAVQWTDVDLSMYANVSIWPRAGANPIEAADRADYFDSMFHSHAVVGINTSALIESGIIGRRVYSILVPEFSGTQEGTLHFQHLKSVEGGLLQLAPTLSEHVAQVAAALESPLPPAAMAKVGSFVQSFVRPHGLTAAATPRIVDAIEQIGATGVAPTPVPAARTIGRLVLTPMAIALMLASIERDRWRSWAVQLSSRPRKGLRAIWRGVRQEGMRATRLARGGTRQLTHRGAGAVRRVQRFSRHVMNRSRGAAHRILRGASDVE